MKKLYFPIIFISCLLVSTGVFAQTNETIPNASRGYYIKDSVMHSVWISDDDATNRWQYVSIPNQVAHKGIAFFPGDITAYSVENKLFISTTIEYKGEKRQVFVEEMFKENDGTKIYYYCDEAGMDYFYMVDKNGSTTYATHDNPKPMWDFVKLNSACSNLNNVRPFPKKITYNNVNTFYTAYRDCNNNLFQRFKWGFTASIGVCKFITNEIPEYEYDYSFAFSAGLFMSVPLDKHFTFKPSVLISKMNNDNGKPQTFGDNMRYDRTSFQFPLLFCYNFTTKTGKTIPYIEFGPLLDLAFSGAKYEGGKKLEHKSNDVVDYNTIIDFHWGVSIGAGIEQKITPKNSLFLGIRWNFTNNRRDDYKEKLKYWMLTAGFSL